MWTVRRSLSAGLINTVLNQHTAYVAPVAVTCTGVTWMGILDLQYIPIQAQKSSLIGK